MDYILFNKICLDDIVWKSQESRWRLVTHEAEHDRITLNKHKKAINNSIKDQIGKTFT